MLFRLNDTGMPMRRLDISRKPGFNRRDAALMTLAGAFWPAAARAVIITPPLIAQPPPTPPAAPGEDANLGTLTDLYRRMTAPVRVNGQGPFAFVVDTGANRSVISSELAAQLSLPLGPDQMVNDAAGMRLTPTVTASLTIGARGETRVVMPVMPAATVGGLGMLGVDRLDGRRLTLDFKAQQLRIESGRPTRDPLDVVVPARSRHGQLTLVDADLAGAPITAFLDSGAQITIGNAPLLALARVKNPTSVWADCSIISAMGQTIAAVVADVPSLRVGGLSLSHLPVAFADLHTFHLWDLGKRPAMLLGVDVLSQFDYVSLDFVRGEVRFRLPPHPDDLDRIMTSSTAY